MPIGKSNIPRLPQLIAGGLAVAVLVATLDIDLANRAFGAASAFVVSYFAGLFTTLTTICVLALGALAFHPNAAARLGPATASPAFSRTAWLAMLFSAGLASGILYWGAAEPITHLQANPFQVGRDIAPNTAAAAQLALTVTTFHWGLHGWALYVLGGLAISIAAYRHQQPLTFRSALYPVLGGFIDSNWGRAIDLLGLLGTVFGVATSLGLAVAGMNATLAALFGTTSSITTQLVIIALVTGLGIASALSGLVRGIRLLSLTNVWVSVALLAAVLTLGPTRALLHLIAGTAIDYTLHVLSMGFFVASSPADQSWQGSWTVFYWAWWLAWMPFVSLFVARISYGRTIREFIIWVMLVPTAVVVVWMSVFGGTALFAELQAPGSISGPVGADYSQGIVQVIATLGSPAVVTALLAVVAVLLFSWLITSLDSATLVVCHLLGEDDSPRSKWIWGLLLGAVSAVLLAAGGVPALQAASIVVGLPIAFLTIGILVAVVREVVGAQKPEHEIEAAAAD